MDVAPHFLEIQGAREITRKNEDVSKFEKTYEIDQLLKNIPYYDSTIKEGKKLEQNNSNKIDSVIIVKISPIIKKPKI